MSDTSGVKFSTPPLILNQPEDASGPTGPLSIVATGKHDLFYQWYNTTGSVAGAESSTFVPSFYGEDYYCVVSNDLGSSTSNSATFLQP